MIPRNKGDKYIAYGKTYTVYGFNLGVTSPIISSLTDGDLKSDNLITVVNEEYYGSHVLSDCELIE